MPKSVLVTGCSGFFGSSLVRSLALHPFVRRVVGVDTRPPPAAPQAKFKFIRSDIRDETYLRTILEQEEIDAVFHLAFLLGEFPERMVAHSLNVAGSLAIVEAASKASRVQKMIVASSAMAYGARSSNALFMTEERSLRAGAPPYAYWKRRLEEEMAKLRPNLRADLQLAVLRICTLAGTSAGFAGPVRKFLESPAGVSVLFRDCPVQFIAEEDLLRVLARILEVQEFRGVFNVAPDDYTTVKTLCRKLKRTHLRLPYPLLWLLFLYGGRFKPSWGVSAGAAPYLAHPIVLDNKKLKRALEIEFSVGSEAAFLACAQRWARASAS